MRVNHLGRTGMYIQAFEHILENDTKFPYKMEDWDRIDKTRKYDPRTGTTSPEFEKLCKDINDWLNNHYDMFEIDYTNFNDPGSREECVLCYTKRLDEWGHPDFESELPKLVVYR